MSYDEALRVIRSVCAAHQGNLQDHQMIQQALAIVEQASKPVERLKTDSVETVNKDA